MDDLISRSGLIKMLSRNSIVEKTYIGDMSVLDIVKAQPTIEVLSVVYGEWKYSPKENIATCKMCSYEHYLGTYHQYARNFCPNCGADMRKGGA